MDYRPADTARQQIRVLGKMLVVIFAIGCDLNDMSRDNVHDHSSIDTALGTSTIMITARVKQVPTLMATSTVRVTMTHPAAGRSSRSATLITVIS